VDAVKVAAGWELWEEAAAAGDEEALEGLATAAAEAEAAEAAEAATDFAARMTQRVRLSAAAAAAAVAAAAATRGPSQHQIRAVASTRT